MKDTHRDSPYKCSEKHSKTGTVDIYEEGSIAVWMGTNPAIVRILGKCNSFPDSYTAVNDRRKNYSSMSKHWLRPATPQERYILGDDNIVLISFRDLWQSIR